MKIQDYSYELDLYTASLRPPQDIYELENPRPVETTRRKLYHLHSTIPTTKDYNGLIQTLTALDPTIQKIDVIKYGYRYIEYFRNHDGIFYPEHDRVPIDL